MHGWAAKFHGNAGGTGINLRGFELTCANLINSYTTDVSGGVFIKLGGGDLILFNVAKG